MNELLFIGEIETPYNTLEECPHNIQKGGPLCRIKLFDNYKVGLFGLEKGQKIVVIYWLYGIDRTASVGMSHHMSGQFGTFAKRTPIRPNPMGLAVLDIEDIDESTITVRGMDCLNGTKLLDIKPAIYEEVGMK